MKPFGLDALLGGWPAQDPQEKGGRSWDERAEAITQAALALEAKGSPEVIEALLAPPTLEAEPGEEKAASFQFDDARGERVHQPKLPGDPQKMSNDQPSQPKKPSLKELAARASQAGVGRASVTPLPGAARASSPPATGGATVTPIAKARAARASDPDREDSGVLRLADLQAQEAARAEAAATAAEAALAAMKAPRAVAASAPMVAAPAAAAGGGSGNKVGMWAGAAIAVLGIAAAVAVYQTRRPATSPGKTDAPVVAASQGDAPPAGAPKPQASGEPAVVASSDSSPAGSVAPKGDEAKGDEAKGAGGGSAPTSTAVASGDTKPASTAPLKGGKVGTLDEEMKKAVGANESQPAPQDDSRPASGSSGGNIPEQPSQGNAQAAVRAVLPAARACVAGAPDTSSASVTFGSSGAVQSVSVSGWAAANGKTGCVKSALQGAHVSPFAKPTFTVPVTIRP